MELTDSDPSLLAKSRADAPVLGDRRRVYLLPGQLYTSSEPCQIKTILGSCVAICLWDKRRSAGGMNHFLLPASHAAEASLRYADEATRVLLEQLRVLGCRPPNLRAKIFGGSAILQNRNRYAASLGAQNVAVALQLMKEAGIPVIAQETGGAMGRRVIFNTDDGAVWAQKI